MSIGSSATAAYTPEAEPCRRMSARSAQPMDDFDTSQDLDLDWSARTGHFLCARKPLNAFGCSGNWTQSWFCACPTQRLHLVTRVHLSSSSLNCVCSALFSLSLSYNCSRPNCSNKAHKLFHSHKRRSSCTRQLESHFAKTCTATHHISSFLMPLVGTLFVCCFLTNLRST